ncbi:MAG: DUF1015 family protein [Lachnospiraceae bacterium]|nr:DUF1015 family protein [Lachnospiraceae bacterium]
MATIKAFQAFRPEKKITDRVAALPYDVYNREEARETALKEPLSFLNIDRPETQFPEDYDMYAPEVYAKAKDMLDSEIKDGVFVQDKKACYYLYELTMNGRAQTGIVACASIDDYIDGVIKKHENTRADKELDRIKHVDTCSAQTGPIFLAYRSDDEIEKTVRKVKENAPEADFTSEDSIRHRVWMIDSDADIDTIRSRFASIKSIYIADGHHRAASAVKVGLMRREQEKQAKGSYDKTAEYNFFLSVLFPENELMIMDYNRVVKDLNGLSDEEFLKKISTKFEVTKVGKEAFRPTAKAEFGMYLGREWYKLTAKNGSFNEKDPVAGLDVSVLQSNLLAPILGIFDPKTDKRIDFVGGIRGLKELERRCESEMKIAFSMYPTSILELFDVADAGLLMPPKSTWFEPKLRSGLFIHRF